MTNGKYSDPRPLTPDHLLKKSLSPGDERHFENTGLGTLMTVSVAVLHKCFVILYSNLCQI